MIRILQLVIVFILVTTLWLLAPGAGVPILAYHQVNSMPEIYSVDAGEFEQQMQYLAEHGYTAISLAELFDARQGHRPLPPKPVIITFDDGYADNYHTALPLMQKYGMKGTVFVIAGQVGQSEYMTWEQLKAMQAAGIELGSHTYNHVALPELSPPQQLDELVRSKQLLEAHLAQPVKFLAYPFGQFNAETMTLVEQAGYTGACTGVPGVGTGAGDAYQLRRVNVPRPKYGLWEFRLRLIRAHIYGKLASLH